MALLVVLVVTGALFPREAGAQSPPPAVLLLLHGDELPKERLREALSRELNRGVVLAGDGGVTSGVVTVTYRRAANELAVTWDGPKRGTVARVIVARSKVDDVVLDAAILAGNLARDEAEDLVRPAEPLPTVPPEVPAPPPPAPVEKVPPVVEAKPPAAPKRRDLDFAEANVSVLYPLALNLDRPWLRTRFDFNLIHGRVGQIDGVQLGGFNVVASARGKGTGDVTGLQLGYLGNVATRDLDGLQLGWLANVTGRHMVGWQTAFVTNIAGGDATGFQATLGLNYAGGKVRGAQLAGVNVAGDVDGVQFGFVNVGRKVNGVMVGLVNVADDIDGVPIGIANVTKSGGVHPAVWGSTGTLANVGVKLATKYSFTMPSLHYHHAYGRDFVGGGFTIGGHFEIGQGPYLQTDLGVAWLIAPALSGKVLPSGATDTYHEHLVQPRVRLLFGYKFDDHFRLFGGAGLLTQVRLERGGEEATIRLGPEFVLGVEL